MSESESRLILGIDGGGTSTFAWLATDTGRRLGQGKAGPSNAKAVGAQAALEAIDQATTLAFQDAGIERRPLDAVCLGLAGFDRPDDRAFLQSIWGLEERTSRLVLVNDAELVLAAGTPNGSGVAVISGTGSIAAGRSPSGQVARAGGWGHIMGDEGSAFGTVQSALRLVARRVDGRDSLDETVDMGHRSFSSLKDGGPLGRRLCRELGVAEPSLLISAVYRPEMTRTRIAGLVVAVLEAADEDPEIYTRILEPAGRELALAAVAVARAIQWPEQTLPLAFGGTFLCSTVPIQLALLQEVRRRVRVEPVVSLVTEPVSGAVTLARRALMS